MRLLLSCLIALVFVPAYAGVPRLALWSDHPHVSAHGVALGPGLRHDARVGALTWLGGIAIDSGDTGFGGFSSLLVNGSEVTLLSDGGNWLRFALDPRGGLHHPAFGALPGGPGTGWQKHDRDSESMTVDPATGTIWAGFENYNAIWRYTPGFARAEAAVAPPAMADWPSNGGPEAMVRLADGRFVVISETGRAPHRRHGRDGLIFARDPTTGVKPQRFVFHPPRGYSPSDMTELPDGRLLVLVRRFAPPFGFTAKLVELPRDAVRTGADVTGRVIATLAPPLLHDNFEGVAARREGDVTVIWLVSDDNQSILQRTLLLKFRLDG